MIQPPNIYNPIYVCASVKGDHLPSQGITISGSGQQKKETISLTKLILEDFFSLTSVAILSIYDSSMSLLESPPPWQKGHTPNRLTIVALRKDSVPILDSRQKM